MARYGRTEHGVVREIRRFNGLPPFHKSLLWYEIGEDVREGWWRLIDGTFQAPPPEIEARRMPTTAVLKLVARNAVGTPLTPDELQTLKDWAG